MSVNVLLCYWKRFIAYRLYTVVPRLVRFIDQLTNWYVRSNRRRIKVKYFCVVLLLVLSKKYKVHLPPYPSQYRLRSLYKWVLLSSWLLLHLICFVLIIYKTNNSWTPIWGKRNVRTLKYCLSTPTAIFNISLAELLPIELNFLRLYKNTYTQEKYETIFLLLSPPCISI